MAGQGQPQHQPDQQVLYHGLSQPFVSRENTFVTISDFVLYNAARPAMCFGRAHVCVTGVGAERAADNLSHQIQHWTPGLLRDHWMDQARGEETTAIVGCGHCRKHLEFVGLGGMTLQAVYDRIAQHSCWA